MTIRRDYLVWAVLLGVLAMSVVLPVPLCAQTAPSFSDRWRDVPPTKPNPPKAPQANSPVSVEQALYLIRSTLLTLNDANRSGNYSVLRDLAAPSLQAKNTAADLAQIFSDLRSRHFDLFAVALAAPQLSAAPALDSNGMLRLAGTFPTRPLQINFDLLYQNVGSQWRPFGISVGTSPAATAQAAAPRPSAAGASQDRH